MLDTGYKRGVIEGGMAAQAVQEPTSINHVQRERLAQERLAIMRAHGYTGVEDTAAFWAGFSAGWDTAVTVLSPMPTLEELPRK